MIRMNDACPTKHLQFLNAWWLPNVTENIRDHPAIGRVDHGGDRAGFPGSRADHGPAAGPSQRQDPRREDPMGRDAEAARAYEAAIARSEDLAERDFLQRHREAIT